MKPPGSYADAARDAEGRLPVASPTSVRAHVIHLLRRHKGMFIALTLLNGVAAIASVIGPQILGHLVESLDNGLTIADVNKASLVFLAALLVQTLFTGLARMRGAILGETILADLREDFLTRVVALPPGVVEQRGPVIFSPAPLQTSTDCHTQFDLPYLRSPSESSPRCLCSGRCFLPRRCLPFRGCSQCRSSCSPCGGTSIALRRVTARRCRVTRTSMLAWRSRSTRDVRSRRTGWDRRESNVPTEPSSGGWVGSATRCTCGRSSSRQVEIAYVLPLAAVLALGGWLYANGTVSIAQVTAAVIYTQMLIEPVDIILMWYDELQVGQASLARLLGVYDVEDPPTDADSEPASAGIVVDDVRFGYREGRDVLHGVSMDIRPGERIAIVGPSGAGKSTLGRLLAGLHAPRTGTVEMGGVALSRLPVETVRRHVALVTQEHHVFVGSLRDNLRLARPSADDEELWAALEAVDADEWASGLAEGLDTQVGTGRHKLTPAEAQQIALARLVLADPHTLVLDEATSLLDPRAARHFEQSLAAVLEGRTVVAIAHRLMTAHDAQRVVVVEDGRIAEAGTHDELVENNGAYAALWRSWRDEE